jgi:hypothetical protein
MEFNTLILDQICPFTALRLHVLSSTMFHCSSVFNQLQISKPTSLILSFRQLLKNQKQQMLNNHFLLMRMILISLTPKYMFWKGLSNLFRNVL